MSNFNVAIIGAGPGGYVSAIRAAQLGQKVVIIDKFEVGGTCLNIGCIPTKTFVKTAEIIHEAKHLGERGVSIGAPEVDMPGVVKMKNNVVRQLTGGVKSLLAANGVELIKGEAVITAEHELEVEGQTISFEKLILATGSSNFIPPIPGLGEEGIMTSTEILDLETVPESLVIIGGGVIGCEFATIFNNFGSRVTIVEMMPAIVPTMDRDISNDLKNNLVQNGIEVLTDCKVSEVLRDNGKYAVRIEGRECEPLISDKVLVSIGRSPNLAGLEFLDLQMERNYIKVNERMETSIPGIYAIGDITGTIQLAHVASAQGIVAAENIAGLDAVMSYDAVPSCIYTIPEIGSVGLTEAQAREKYESIITSRFPMMACGKALAMGAPAGFTKLVAEEGTGRLLGCHIIGTGATEIIGEAAYIVKSGGTIHDITHTIHAHPTIAETIMEAAHMASGEPIHMPPPRKA